jgi:FkbM family methyltransferase
MSQIQMIDHQPVRVNTALHGTEYGGWTICPDHLSACSTIYSFGIGEDASFDTEVIRHYGAEVHAFDPTPKSLDWVKKQSWPAKFHFHPIGIGASDRVAAFFPPENPGHVSHSILERGSAASAIQVKLQRLATIAEKLGHREIEILKMDIEGAEYEVVDDLVKTPEVRIRQILVEFHHFFPGIAVEATDTAIRQLDAAGYRVFNVSKRGYEYSFIRL